jgi:thiol:disulfide interchange protein
MKRISRVAVVSSLALAMASAHSGTLSAADLEAGAIRWRSSYYDAAQEATRTNKPMLMQITATWCGACQNMLSSTLSDGTVVEQVNATFIPFRIDADRHAELVEQLQVQSLPTTIVIDPDLTILSRLAGFRGSASFADALVEAARRHSSRAQAATSGDGPREGGAAQPVSYSRTDGAGLRSIVLRLMGGF